MSSPTSAPTVVPELDAGRPPFVRVDCEGDALSWVQAHRDALVAAVAEHGALVVRGLGLTEMATVEAVVRALGPPMTERESFAPRREYAPGIYSSAKWPPGQPMCMHHELSFRLEVPSLLVLACLEAPESGGTTGLADAGAVLDAMPAELVARFEREGWLLVRNYNEDIGASVGEAFGTEDKDEVERYCRDQAIDFEWQVDGGLRTWQRRHAIVRHPVSGRRCWFNQVAFLNEHTLDPEVREFLVDMYGPDGLPFTTRFGNGEPIGPEVVGLLNEIYERHTVGEPWEVGDLMLIDNIATAHSREPYRGTREVVVAMTRPTRLTEGEASGMSHR